MSLALPSDDSGWVMWYGSDLQTNSVIENGHYTPIQNNKAATAHAVQNPVLSFPSAPPATSPSSPHFLPTPQQTQAFPPFRGISNVSDPYTFALWGAPLHPTVREADASLLPPPPMITLPMIPTPAPAPPMGPNSSQAQRPRFACSICPKTFSSRVRAETCLNNHMNIKPFACNGIIISLTIHQPETLRV